MRSARLLPAVAVAILGALLALPLKAADLQALARLAESGDLAAAESGLREHLTQGEDPVARDLLGVVLTRQGRFDEAEGEFRRALEADPELLPAHQHLARLLLSQDRPEQALATLRRAAEIGPLERALAFYLADRELEAGHPERAETQLFSLAQRFDSPRALHQLAQLRWRQGAIGEASNLLRQALDLAPDSTALLDSYARLSLAHRQPVPAIIALEALERMRPGGAGQAYLLGVAHLQVGDMASAVQTLDRAVELQPREALTWAALGLALNNQKRYERAQQVLEQALGLAPESPEALAAMAEALTGLGRLSEAESYVRRALAGDPEQATAHMVSGLIAMERGDYEEARDALEAAIAASDGLASTKAHYQLSLAYARLGDAEASRRHVELYRQALARSEEFLKELRRAGTGPSPAGGSAIGPSASPQETETSEEPERP